MSRVFQTFTEASQEIRRDIAKSPTIPSSRVQHHIGKQLEARERIGYEYVIQNGGIPMDSFEFANLAAANGFKPYQDAKGEMVDWLDHELEARLFATDVLGRIDATEKTNPLLRHTLEGNWPSYTYTERLSGMMSVVSRTLADDLTSRRAFWPIYWPSDTGRMMAPTRIPCSLGYQFIVREVEGTPYLNMVYLQRSCDFDRFWASDVWFGYRTLLEMRYRINAHMSHDDAEVEVGNFHHYIVSFHSFAGSMEEIY